MKIFILSFFHCLLNSIFIHREGSGLFVDIFPEWIGSSVKSFNIQIWLYSPFHNTFTLNPIADYKGGWGRYVLQVICVRVVVEPVHYYCSYTARFNKIQRKS